MRWSVACKVKPAALEKDLSYSTLAREKEMITCTYRILPGRRVPADEKVDLVVSCEVHWLSLSTRVAEDLLMSNRDRRRIEATRATLEPLAEELRDA